MSFYDLLFADQHLEELILDMEFPPGSPLHAARARIWEGRFEEASAIGSSKGDDPVAALVVALARIKGNLGAKRTLLALAEDPQKESRMRAWAWTALRRMGEQPSGAWAGDILGVVVEVPIHKPGDKPIIDVIAAYSDGSARAIVAAPRYIVREPIDGQPNNPLVEDMLKNALPLLNEPITERTGQPPKDERLRFSALTPNGLHIVEQTWNQMERPWPYALLFQSALVLFEAITAK
jgi:hypothetical protein